MFTEVRQANLNTEMSTIKVKSSNHSQIGLSKNNCNQAISELSNKRGLNDLGKVEIKS